MHWLQRKNTSNANSLRASLQYIFDFIEPGDVRWVGDLVTVCQAKGHA